MSRAGRWRARAGLVLVALVVASAGPADAAPPTTAPPVDGAPAVGDDTDTDAGVTDTLPLVPVPPGCTAPPTPHVVFVGEVVDRDVRTIRYRIESIRFGVPDPFAGGDLIDVRYGLDAQYLDDGETYLVSAVVDPDLGVLASRVTDPVENFGGDDIIGVSESDVDCPDYEDPMRTLHTDGTPIDAGVLEPFLDAKMRILGAVLVPAGLTLGAIFLLASFRLSISGLYRSVTRTPQRPV